MNPRKFLTEAGRAATLVRMFALLAAMVGICESAAPRSAAVVAVAVAVDELLQTNGPDLPDTLDDGKPEEPSDVTPEPVRTPCDCAAKCGKLDCQCKASAVGCLKPLLSIDDAALGSIKPRPRIVVTISSPVSFPCDRCVAMKHDADEHDWRDGDLDVEIRWVEQDVSGAVGYPWMTAEGFTPIYGRTNLAGIRQWLKLPAVKPAQAVSAFGTMTVGSVDGAAIRAALAQLRPNGKATEIRLGGVAITIPASLTIELSTSADRIALRFPGSPRPRVSYGSGWLAVSQAINAITLTGERLTVGLDGFPDLAFRVE